MKFLIKKTPDNFIKSVNDEISSILNRHFDNYYPEYGFDDVEKMTMPLEVRDKKEEYDIRAELPGVKKEDLDIEINENYLTINITSQGKLKLKYLIEKSLKEATSLNICHFPQNNFQTE